MDKLFGKEEKIEKNLLFTVMAWKSFGYAAVNNVNNKMDKLSGGPLKIIVYT